MLKRLVLTALVVSWPSYSFSDSIKPYYDVTNNAAAAGLSWNMDALLPSPPGLDILGVIYSYRIRKDSSAAASVVIQNNRADGEGYVFRSQDDWLPGSQDGTRLNRVVPVVPGIPRTQWGDGSIEVSGEASVESPSVLYQYRVDPCFDPQASPACPGYVAPPPSIYETSYSLYDASAEGHDRISQFEDPYGESEEESDEEREEREAREERRREARLEAALAAADTTALFAQAIAAQAALDAMALAVNMNAYYTSSIPGGAYSDSIVLPDKQLPDNPSGLRNGLAQQLLHQRMVDMQYKGE